MIIIIEYEWDGDRFFYNWDTEITTPGIDEIPTDQNAEGLIPIDHVKIVALTVKGA